MTSEELGALVFLTGYVGVLLLAMKVFGVRRVLWVLFGIIFLGVWIAMRTLSGITGRRY